MFRLRNIGSLCLGVFVSSCASSHSDVRVNRLSGSPHILEEKSPDHGISAIAAREVIRRQERVRRADAAALRANKFSAEGNHEAAIRSYRQALEALPPSD